jgi:hypothetical protein
MAKGAPRKPSGEEKKNQFDLFFDWAKSQAVQVAERLAALTARLEDFSFVSLGFGSLIVPIFIAVWWATPEDSAVRPTLAKASLIAFALAIVAWATRGLHSTLGRKNPLIIIHLIAFCGSVAVSGWALTSMRHSDAARDVMRAEQAAAAAKKRAEQAEEDRRVKADQEATAKVTRDAAVKDAECLAKFASAVRATQRRQLASKTKLETCQVEFAKKILPLTTMEHTCRVEYAEVEGAEKAHASALKKVCAAGSLR